MLDRASSGSPNPQRAPSGPFPHVLMHGMPECKTTCCRLRQAKRELRLTLWRICLFEPLFIAAMALKLTALETAYPVFGTKDRALRQPLDELPG